MAIGDIDILQLQALQRGVNSLQQILSIQGIFFVHAVAKLGGQPPEKLGGDNVGQSVPAELFQGQSHQGFRLATCVYLGVIKEIHTVIASGCHQV